MQIRIATRRSRLARTQTEWVAARLREVHRGLTTVIVEVATEGDRDRATPLADIGGSGLFTKALQDAVAEGDADLAVHSYKDLPTAEPDGLAVAAVPERADYHDVLVTAAGGDLGSLPAGALVGTSSPRRAQQLSRVRSDLRTAPIRGNVETRIAKVRSGEFDATILAAAGLARLGLSDAVCDVLDFLPAPGQGALALECRSSDARTRELVSTVDDPDTRDPVTAERAWLAATGAGCATSAAALGTLVGDDVELRWSFDGREGSARGPRREAARIGREAVS
ncbi:MAG: hydroxymethylbilane synthase [Acidimicrobiia bacterium]|nr:hydroxymethylbilane synthase [Acidimicrobiia bacterium]